MLDINKPPPSSDTKTYFSHSLLPSYIDPLNPPSKKKPFHTFSAQPFSHSLDLLLPPEIWDLVRAHLEEEERHRVPQVYARAWLKLSDVLEEEFLDAYVRNASTTLLSSGREKVDTRFEIVNGLLKIEMPRPVYERAGLVGKAIEDGGAKHQRNRWVVEYDLTAPSMKKGKKGFERLRWAARDVLSESQAWLVYCKNPGFGESVREGREVLSQHAPKIFDLKPEVEVVKGAVVPKLDVASNGLSALYDQDDALALLEWLDMLNLGSARVQDGQPLDSHLCRYDLPDFEHGTETHDLTRIRWQGLITPEFVRDLFLAVWKTGYKGRREPKRRKGDPDGDVSMEGTQDEDKEGWFAMSAQAFGGRRAWSLMQFKSRETLAWEVEG